MDIKTEVNIPVINFLDKKEDTIDIEAEIDEESESK